MPKTRWQIMSCGHVILPKLLGRGEAPFELENSGVNQKSGVPRRSPFFHPDIFSEINRSDTSEAQTASSGQNHNLSDAKCITFMHLNLPWQKFGKSV